jgi:hypothetical protein
MRKVHALTVGLGLVASTLPLAVPTVAAAPENRAGPGVCARVPGCHIVAKGDVSGDGSKDVIGIASRGASGSEGRAVIVRVKTAPDKIVSTRWQSPYWHGPFFNGLTPLDGRAGKEIVVGQTQGAHAQLYRSLTWRHGDVVTLDAPGGSPGWLVDAAAMVSYGWQRRAIDPVGTVRRRVADRYDDPEMERFKGRITTYRWTTHGWIVVETRSVYPLSDRRAYSWAGFHIPGLDRGF